MWHTTINKMRSDLFVFERNFQIETQAFRLAHLEGDAFTVQLRADHAGRRLKRKRLHRTRDATREARKTPRAIATHFGFAAIGVIVSHAKICAVRRSLQNQNSIRANPSMPIADVHNLLGGELQLAGAIIEQNEIVPCAVHLGELNHDFS